jgi:electron transfer flavoprotein alpha subunit
VSEAGEIWILGEIGEDNKISRSTLGLLTLGRKLADVARGTLCSIFLGEDVTPAAERALSLGSDKVFVFQDDSYASYAPELFVHTIESVCRKHHPDIFLAGHTAMGQDLLPRLAARLDAHIVTDCIDLRIDEATGKLLMTKPVYGGNAVAIFSSDASPQLATVRTRIAIPPQFPARKGELIPCEPIPVNLPNRIKRIFRAEDQADGLRLEDADIIVSGGRGIGNAEGFAQLRELAKSLHGVVGASRPPCDVGWVSPHLQIGLTGKTVAPKAYFAVAISGMMQHITGMFESQRVIAINKDKDANIFRMADYGVVGDYREVVPALTGKLKELANE